MKNAGLHRFAKGFTLIELLIVIAIIAILALIAIPNFLEAQVRAKVSHVRANQRTMGTALEAYYVDYGSYPVQHVGSGSDWFCDPIYRFKGLSTPIAYVTDLYANSTDVFDVMDEPNLRERSLVFANRLGWARYKREHDSTPPDWAKSQSLPYWYLISCGPDRDQKVVTDLSPLTYKKYSYGCAEWYSHQDSQSELVIASNYDPTNGTVSNGNIVRSGP